MKSLSDDRSNGTGTQEASPKSESRSDRTPRVQTSFPGLWNILPHVSQFIRRYIHRYKNCQKLIGVMVSEGRVSPLYTPHAAFEQRGRYILWYSRTVGVCNDDGMLSTVPYR